MRENHKMMALTAILAAGVVLAGCGATNSAASSTVASATSTASSEVEKTEVQPMQGISLSDPLADGTYHISFEKIKYGSGNARTASTMPLFTTMTGTQPKKSKL